MSCCSDACGPAGKCVSSKCSKRSDAKAECCGLHCRLHVGELVGGSHISQCGVLRVLLRPCSRGPAQQPALLVGQRLNVCNKLKDGLQVFLAVEQLHLSLRSATVDILRCVSGWNWKPTTKG